MPFTNRDRPKLSERLRGRSGEELLNDIKSAFDNDRRDRRMFFENPGWTNEGRSTTAFPRGFPFDDEDFGDFGVRRSRPAFTDRPAAFGENWHEPPWQEDPRRKRPREPEEAQPEQHGEQTDQKPPLPGGLSQHGLRNTVPLAQGRAEGDQQPRPPRAMSAPPGDRGDRPQPRFVASCEIPVSDPHQQPQQAPQQAQPQQQQQPSNVRVIPIQVEGRDEPLLNSNLDTSSTFASEPQQQQFEGRLPRDFGPFRKHSSRFQPQQQQQPPPAAPQRPTTPQQRAPAAQQRPHTAPAPPQRQPQNNNQQFPPRPPQKGSSVDEPDRGTASPQPPPDPAAIALARVAEVQKEVDELGAKVAEATPTSRTDKQYVYLDEMLTRQLLRLDDIDTHGQENIRTARKDAIRSIQKNISILESKVPQEPMEVDAESTETVEQQQGEQNADSAPQTGEPMAEEATPSQQEAPPTNQGDAKTEASA